MSFLLRFISCMGHRANELCVWEQNKRERGIVVFSSVYSLKGKVWSFVVLSMCCLTSAQQDTFPHGPVTVFGLIKRWLVCGSWFQWSITSQKPRQRFPGVLLHRRAWSRIRSVPAALVFLSNARMK